MTRQRWGTPALLSFAALDGALEAFAGVAMSDVRAKSIRMTELFAVVVERLGHGTRLELVSPRSPEARGSQLSCSHPYAFELVQALIDRHIIGDFRAPSIARFGLAPLYLRYAEVWEELAPVSRTRGKVDS
jgi:kynureninase